MVICTAWKSGLSYGRAKVLVLGPLTALGFLATAWRDGPGAGRRPDGPPPAPFCLQGEGVLSARRGPGSSRSISFNHHKHCGQSCLHWTVGSATPSRQERINPAGGDRLLLPRGCRAVVLGRICCSERLSELSKATQLGPPALGEAAHCSVPPVHVGACSRCCSRSGTRRDG